MTATQTTPTTTEEASGLADRVDGPSRCAVKTSGEVPLGALDDMDRVLIAAGVCVYDTEMKKLRVTDGAIAAFPRVLRLQVDDWLMVNELRQLAALYVARKTGLDVDRGIQCLIDNFTDAEPSQAASEFLGRIANEVQNLVRSRSSGRTAVV